MSSQLLSPHVNTQPCHYIFKISCGLQRKVRLRATGYVLKDSPFPSQLLVWLELQVFFFHFIINLLPLQSFSLLKIWHSKESQYVTQRQHPEALTSLHENKIFLPLQQLTWVNFTDPLFHRYANIWNVINWHFLISTHITSDLGSASSDSEDTSKDF